MASASSWSGGNAEEDGNADLAGLSGPQPRRSGVVGRGTQLVQTFVSALKERGLGSQPRRVIGGAGPGGSQPRVTFTNMLIERLASGQSEGGGNLDKPWYAWRCMREDLDGMVFQEVQWWLEVWGEADANGDGQINNEEFEDDHDVRCCTGPGSSSSSEGRYSCMHE